MRKDPFGMTDDCFSWSFVEVREDMRKAGGTAADEAANALLDAVHVFELANVLLHRDAAVEEAGAWKIASLCRVAARSFRQVYDSHGGALERLAGALDHGVSLTVRDGEANPAADALREARKALLALRSAAGAEADRARAPLHGARKAQALSADQRERARRLLAEVEAFKKTGGLAAAIRFLEQFADIEAELKEVAAC